MSDAKMARLTRGRDAFRPLLEEQRIFENKCEEVFGEFRVAVMHLRREPELLDMLEDKALVWRFLRKLSRERKPLWPRCEEVIGFLMGRDSWVQAFAEDPQADANDLPPNILKEFQGRLRDFGGGGLDASVKVVLVGCGVAAMRHCTLMARYNERTDSAFFRVTALYDKDPRRIRALKASRLASQCGAADAEELGSQEALQTVEVHVAVVSSYSSERESAVTALLRRELPVLVEAPLLAEPLASVRFAQAVRQLPLTQQRLFVAEPGDFLLGVSAAKAAGLGDIVSAECQAVLPSGLERDELLDDSRSCCLVPGLRSLRALQRVLGPVEEVCSMQRPACGSTSGSSSAPQPRNPRNPFQKVEPPPPSQSPGGSTSGDCDAMACLLRHKSGVISTMRAKLGGAALTCPHLVVNGTAADVVADSKEVLIVPATHGASSTVALSQQPTGEDGVYHAFAERLRAKSNPGGLDAGFVESLQAHLVDLAVAAACQASARSRRFEPVKPLA